MAGEMAKPEGGRPRPGGNLRFPLRGLTLGVAAMACLPPAWADPSTANQSTPSSTDRMCCASEPRVHTCPFEGSFTKLGRGVSNVLAGWLEVPETIRRRYSPDDVGSSIATGVAVGVLRTIMRTGVGLYETLTCPLPIPQCYRPILPPLDSFQRRDRSRVPFWAD